jgi:hypothetical protein
MTDVASQSSTLAHSTEWAYWWNAPRPAIAGPERPLTRDEFRQGQAVLAKVKTLSHDLYETFIGRHKYLLKEKGLHAANKYLVFTLGRTILPRVDSVNAAHSMDFNASLQFMSEADAYHRLPNLNDKSVRQLAQDVAGQLKGVYETRCEELIADKDGDNTILFEDSTQVELYAQLAGMARAFNVCPMHWKKYRKGRLDAHFAIASLSRLVNPDWWVRQLKSQRTR